MPVINKPNQHFNTVLYTGNSNSGNNVIDVGFAPDMVWLKSRTQTYNHYIYDTVRGSTVHLSPNSIAAEGSDSVGFSFSSTGFVLNTTGGSGINESGQGANNMVGWCWKAGGTAVTNTNGSITSQVSANPTAGFSIVSYASGSSGDKTVGHGLSSAPKVIITKSRNGSTFNWSIYHASAIDAVTKFLRFTTDGIITSSNIWGSALPTSTVFGISSGNGVEASTNCIAYCWSEVEGYSRFGSYTGNGSTDGPFVHTGFRPELVIVKDTQGNNWEMYDTLRGPRNVIGNRLFPSNNAVDNTAEANIIDALSNGFKVRGSYGGLNLNGRSHVFMAFAESPFKYANAR